MTKLVSLTTKLRGADRSRGYYDLAVQMEGWGFADYISVGASAQEVANFFQSLAKHALSQSPAEPEKP
jgi:hypothetical protein